MTEAEHLQRFERLACAAAEAYVAVSTEHAQAVPDCARMALTGAKAVSALPAAFLSASTISEIARECRAAMLLLTETADLLLADDVVCAEALFPLQKALAVVGPIARENPVPMPSYVRQADMRIAA